VAYLGAGFQPEIEQVVAELGDDVTVVDLLAVVDLVPVTAPLAGVQGEVDGEVLAGGLDPHAWLSPPMFAEMVDRLGEVLIALAPDARTSIAAARNAYLAELAALDAEFESRLTGCASTALVTSHRAFEYLAREYGLAQIPIAGLSGDEEPDPRTLQAIAVAARAEQVSTVFFEETLPPGLARTVAEEIGAGTAVLDAVETIPQADVDAGASYLTVQRENLDALAEGPRCTG
jgi:zinc transport system substrate-binding protein